MKKENALSSRMSLSIFIRSICWMRTSRCQVLAARNLICASYTRRYMSEVGQCRWVRRSCGRKSSMNFKSQALALLQALLWEITTTAAFWLMRINSFNNTSQRCSSSQVVVSLDLDQEDLLGAATCLQRRRDKEAITQMAWCLRLRHSMDKVTDKVPANRSKTHTKSLATRTYLRRLKLRTIQIVAQEDQDHMALA